MLKEITKEDISSITAIEEACFPEDPWDEDAFIYELNQNPYAKMYAAEKDDILIAYIDLWIVFEQAQIANIAVLPAYQKQGIASELMEFCIQKALQAECENLTLEVRVSNKKAIALYEKYGFIRAAIRKNYYKSGEDAILMVKPLGGLENDSTVVN